VNVALDSSQLVTRQKRSLLGFLKGVYVPAVSIVAMLVVGNWLAARSQFDPLIIARNPRIHFPTGKENLAGVDGLTESEAQLASDVIRKGLSRQSNSNGILFLGDSQTLGIVDETPGDLTTPQWVQVLLARRSHGPDAPVVILGSLPGLTMPEFLLRLVASDQRNPNPPRVVIGAVQVREWRALKVRDSIASMAATPRIRGTLNDLAALNPDLSQANAVLLGSSRASRSSELAERDPGHGAIAGRYEEFCQRLADRIPLFRMRSSLYARTQVDYMRFQNWLLNIHSESKRHLPATTYNASLQLLELSIRYAQSRNITMVLYLSPVRPIETSPIPISDVAKFREDVGDLCGKYQVTCLDYTNLIPDDLWMSFAANRGDTREMDFSHFTGAAHKLLAQHLVADAGALSLENSR